MDILNGKRVTIVPMAERHAETVVAWRNTPDVSGASFSENKLTVESHLGWHASVMEHGDRHDYVIEVEGKPVGVVYIGHIDTKNQCAEAGIFIGEPEFRGRGYASDAMRSILAYAFGTLGMNRVYLKCFSDNEPALRLYERCGFQKEGILRQEVRKGGVFRDVLIMAILKGEFRDA